MMGNTLIVSCTEKNVAIFTEILNEASVNQITELESAGEARKLFGEQEFDLVIIDSPLKDESGESLSRYIAANSFSQVILVVKSGHLNAAAAVGEDDGVLTISKPLNREVFILAILLAKSLRKRIKRIQAENAQLRQKIEDIRIIDRAKLLLISYLNLSEQEAHRFIEKQAMDLRSSKRAIAEGVLKTYAS